MLKLVLLIFKLVLYVISKLLYVIIYNNWLKLVLYPKVWTLFGLMEYKSIQFNSTNLEAISQLLVPGGWYEASFIPRTKMLGTDIQNLVTMVTWHHGFVHLC